ncbi:Peptidase A24A, prepilin type IV [Pseudomonas cannabina]|uniref:Peptidase A24A, prepilin type IV n=3 Tax=Pseudomonas syringae group TaxID=136849 RepID=A0A3M3QWC8_PSECA|nr:Peptidase A24A, prepilin type IV [Pseudomonas cannabina]
MMKLFCLLVWFAVCAEQDARKKEISNRLTLGAMALAAGYLFVYGQTWLGAEPADAALALLIALGLTLPGYALGRLGAGDVKLLAALALAANSTYLLCTFIGAGIAMLTWLIVGRSAWHLIHQGFTQRYRYMNPAAPDKHPFSPFLLAGLLTTAVLIH